MLLQEVGVCNNCMDVHVDSLEAGMRMISDIYQGSCVSLETPHVILHRKR